MLEEIVTQQIFFRVSNARRRVPPNQVYKGLDQAKLDGMYCILSYPYLSGQSGALTRIM